MKKWLLLVVAAAVALAAWWIKERFFVTEEMRVKRLVSGMATNVEKAEITKLNDSISQDFTSEQISDKTTLINAIRLFRLQYAQMFIYISDQTISIVPDSQTAEVTLMVKVVAKPRGGGADTEYHAERIKLFLRKSENGWNLYRTESPKLNFD